MTLNPQSQNLRVSASKEGDNMRLQELKKQAAHNPEYQQLQQIITQGFPDHRNQLPECCRHY